MTGIVLWLYLCYIHPRQIQSKIRIVMSAEWLAAIATALTVIIAIIQGFYMWRQEVIRKREYFQAKLARILELTIEYPYLEDPAFTQSWSEKKDSPDEKIMRYDQFCNLLYNFLEELYKYHKGKTEKIEQFVAVKAWVRLHRQNWEFPREEYENIDAYNTDFRAYINSLIK